MRLTSQAIGWTASRPTSWYKARFGLSNRKSSFQDMRSKRSLRFEDRIIGILDIRLYHELSEEI